MKILKNTKKYTTLTITRVTSDLLGKLSKQLSMDKSKLLEDLIVHMARIADFNKEISNIRFSVNLQDGIMLIWFTPRVTVKIGEKHD